MLIFNPIYSMVDGAVGVNDMLSSLLLLIWLLQDLTELSHTNYVFENGGLFMVEILIDLLRKLGMRW